MIALRRFWDREQGQDLTEWALIIALVVLGSAALMYNSGSSVAKVWVATSATFNPSAPSSPPDGNSSPVTQPQDGSDHHDGDDHGH